jgi:prokaryotic ubiquitin-like protein Pup
MAEREQKKRQAPSKTEEVIEEAPAKSETGEKIKAELDDLLDEIDEVLEVNAEEFVKSYVQKGGQEFGLDTESWQRDRVASPADDPAILPQGC